MLTASKILARPKDSGQRMLLRTSGCRKNVFSSQSPRKTVPGEAISAKLGVLSSGRAPATAPRGLCFQPSSKFAPREAGCAFVGTRAGHRSTRALLPAELEIRSARLQRGGAQHVDLEIAGSDRGGV